MLQHELVGVGCVLGASRKEDTNPPSDARQTDELRRWEDVTVGVMSHHGFVGAHRSFMNFAEVWTMYPIEGTEEIRDNWGWFFGFGVCLVTLGLVAILASSITTVVSVAVAGALMMIGGIAQLIHAISTRRMKGALTNGLIGVLYGFAGYVLVRHPMFGALALTYLLSVLFVTWGVLKLVLGSQLRHFRFTTYMTLSAVASIVLGVLIFAQWPSSAAWVIGTFVGINLVFDGMSWTALGLAAKRFCTPKDPTPPSKVGV
jgi:uncharacterized membrane protein HdeD (DUF308 family)